MVKVLKIIGLFFILFFTGKVIYAQSNVGLIVNNEPAIKSDLLFERFGSKDNLPDNRIRSIFQDSQGVLWIGTMNGVCQYDGYNFKKEINSINSFRHSGSWTSDICEDSLSNIWLGTKDGLNVYNTVSQEFNSYNHDSKDSGSIIDDEIRALLYDQYRNLWIGTAKGLMRLDSITHKFVAYDIYPLNTKINKIIRSFDGYIWIACFDGVVHYNVKNGKFDFYKKEVKPNPYGDRIWSVFEVNKNLLIGTGGEGLLQLKYDTILKRYSQFENISNISTNSENLQETEIFDICQSKTGDIWLGTNRGLAKVQFNTNTEISISFYTNNPTNELSLCNNRVYRVFIDQTDVLWCGTELGLGKLDLALLPIKFYSFVGQNSISPVRSIYSSEKGDIWVGKSDNGLYQFNPKNGKTTSYFFSNPHSSFNSNRSIILWKDKMWIGTLGGAYTINPELRNTNFKIELSGTTVFAFMADSKNNLWIGTNHGLYMESPLGKRVLFINDPANKNSISSNFIRAIYEDHQGRIWIGFDKMGVNYYDPSNGYFSGIPPGQNGQRIYGSTVVSILEYPEETIWIGSEIALNKIVINDSSQGRLRFEISNYFEEDGLVDKGINGILKDGNGNLWLSTINGLDRFNIKKEKFENFLPNIRFYQGSFFSKDDQQLLFGGAEGFVVFDPRAITQSQFLPSAVITDLRLFNKPVKINEKYNGEVILKKAITHTEQISFNYRNNAFTLGFTAMHFSKPEKNQYMYKMDGFDEKWIIADTKNRSATYTNLNSGEYVFRVKAANNSGVWNNDDAKLKITILPPPWKTWYAILGYLVLFNMILFVFIRYALIQSRQRHQIKFDQLEKERLNSLYQMKMRFFTDVSHEFRTPLSLIIGPVDDILHEQTISDNVKAKVIMIQRNCKRLLNLVDELMTFRKIDLGISDLKVSNGDFVSFIRDIVKTFEPLADRKAISLGFIAPAKIENVWFDAWKMEKIINNLLSNALKNTPENGKIVIAVESAFQSDGKGISSQTREFVSIMVEDNGIGIDKKDIPLIFDRFFQTRNGKGGTGVGLSLTKSLVELHKGTISVQSTLGAGTCFKVLIPFGKDHFNISQIIPESGSTEIFVLESDRSIYDDEPITKSITTGTTQYGENQLLLLVEDNLEVREYVRMIFSEQFKIMEANNGAEALVLIAHENPDLVISDVMMPEMDGIELCHKLKTDIATCHIPVILLTAKTALENVKGGFEVGADLYIPKPFQPGLLKLQVENLISSRKRIIQKFQSGEISIPTDITKNPLDAVFMEKVMSFVMKNLDNDDFSVEDLGELIGMSRSNLFRKLKAITGQTPIEYIYFIRIKRSRELLLERRLNVSEIAYEVGFKNPSSFSKSFKKQFGKSPSQLLNDLIEKQSGNQ